MTRCVPESSVGRQPDRAVRCGAVRRGAVRLRGVEEKKRRRCVHASRSTKADLSLSGALLPLDYIHPRCFRGSFQLQIHPHEPSGQRRRRSTSYQGNQASFNTAVHPTHTYALVEYPFLFFFFNIDGN